MVVETRAENRFIPTGVGNTPRVTNLQVARTVHPHGCGEHNARAISDMIDFGSSPRVWGTQLG